MRRIPIQLHDFLRNVLAGLPLTWEEQRLVDRVLEDRSPAEMTHAARALVEGLVERGALQVVERVRAGGTETLVVRDPQRRIRSRLRLPVHARGPEIRAVPLPLEWSPQVLYRAQEVESLLAHRNSLVAGGRVLPSRDLLTRLEQALQELLPVASASFTPLEIPPTEDWPSPPAPNGLPLSPEQLESLSRRRDQLLLLPDLGKDGSLLALGLGDEAVGWRGYLLLRHGDREHFTRDRLARARLVAHHFEGLISESIQLQGLVFIDPLTGIYNRSYFELQFDREIGIADRRGQSLALLLVDVDDFRGCNTRLGYRGGDHVLVTVADVLRTTVRSTDTLARHGGEEFTAILAPPVTLEEAKAIAERLRAAVADESIPVRGMDGRTVNERVTVSIGGVLFPAAGRTYRELWNAANRLLLEAKSRGKNQVRFVGDEPAPAGAGSGEA